MGGSTDTIPRNFLLYYVLAILKAGSLQTYSR